MKSRKKLNLWRLIKLHRCSKPFYFPFPSKLWGFIFKENEIYHYLKYMGNKYHYTIYDFFSFVNEKKKSCTKTQEEIKFKETRFHFLLRIVFSLPVTSVLVYVWNKWTCCLSLVNYNRGLWIFFPFTPHSSGALWMIPLYKKQGRRMFTNLIW